MFTQESYTTGGYTIDYVIDYPKDFDEGASYVVTLNIIRNGEEMSVSLTVTADCLTEY